MIAGMVLSNLLYVVGAIVAATVVSGFVWLRHRRPKSLEAGIEMFSRELKALEPERTGEAARAAGTSYGSRGMPPDEATVRRAAGTPGRGTGAAAAERPVARPVRGGTVTPLPPPLRTDSPEDGTGFAEHRRDGAEASSPDREHDSG